MWSLTYLRRLAQRRLALQDGLLQRVQRRQCLLRRARLHHGLCILIVARILLGGPRARRHGREEARLGARVARGPVGRRQVNERVGVAVREDLVHADEVARRLTLGPQRLPRAAARTRRTRRAAQRRAQASARKRRPFPLAAVRVAACARSVATRTPRVCMRRLWGISVTSSTRGRAMPCAGIPSSAPRARPHITALPWTPSQPSIPTSKGFPSDMWPCRSV